MSWVDIEQNTDEWLTLRSGKIGGSSIGCIMANYGKAFGEPAKRLAGKIALEQITGSVIPSEYSNAHMDRGHEQEPLARLLYEEERFCDVSNGGYFILGDDIGISPDGLVGEDGIIEIKSVVYSTQIKTIERGSFDPAYKWQICFNLDVSGREWLDYISFCADFPYGKKLYITRVLRTDIEVFVEQIRHRLEQFRALVLEKKRVISNA